MCGVKDSPKRAGIGILYSTVHVPRWRGNSRDFAVKQKVRHFPANERAYPLTHLHRSNTSVNPASFSHTHQSSRSAVVPPFVTHSLTSRVSARCSLFFFTLAAIGIVIFKYQSKWNSLIPLLSQRSLQLHMDSVSKHQGMFLMESERWFMMFVFPSWSFQRRDAIREARAKTVCGATTSGRWP